MTQVHDVIYILLHDSVFLLREPGNDCYAPFGVTRYHITGNMIHLFEFIIITEHELDERRVKMYVCYEYTRAHLHRFKRT